MAEQEAAAPTRRARDAKAASASPSATDQLRFVLCGSVDDGKSSLLGRLLFEQGGLNDDELAALERNSPRFGTLSDGRIDLALAVDGLEAELEQGITIDVAYRYFSSARRSFVAIDAPGHEQYTANMATGASNADVAVILVDASKGIVPQTMRHTLICAFTGTTRVILAVNKMDLVSFDRAAFEAIVDGYNRLAERTGIDVVASVPLCAIDGTNVSQASQHTPWYAGPTLLQALDGLAARSDDTEQSAFRLPVQWVNRPDRTFRGYCGTVASGSVAAGDRLRVCRTGEESTVADVLGPDGPVDRAQAGDAVTVCLEREIDISRGDLLAAPEAAPEPIQHFAAHIVWLSREPMLPGRQYVARFATAEVDSSVSDLVHVVDVMTGEPLAAKSLELNGIGYCKVSLGTPLAVTPFQQDRTCGSFVLIDRFSGATVGAGTVDFALRRSANVVWHPTKIDKQARAAANRQRPVLVWFTGLSASGKSSIADRLEQRLHAQGVRTYLLDGDNLRHGLNRDLGFTDADRVENIRRVGEVARLMVDAGLVVLAAFISPFAAERQMVRDLFEDGEFLEVFVDTPLAECERRDPKGLYAKARRGDLTNFTGIDSPYEAPEQPDVTLHGATAEVDELVETVWTHLSQRRTFETG